MNQHSTPSRDELQNHQTLLTPPPPKTPTTHSSSPNKPRLLWRGSLHLSDGTELPGLAIVSTIQPGFGSSSKKVNDEIDEKENKHAPFTLSMEQQDELTLSIEMVRHAPLKVVDILENSLLVDERGKLSISKQQQNSEFSNLIDSKKLMENGMNYINKNVQITFEAAGDVRMYIDPKETSTLAFFDRLFTYNFDHQSSQQNHSSCALIFSLDKSYKDTMKANGLSSSSLTFFNTAISEWQQNHLHSSSTAGYGIDSTGIMEAVVIGVKRQTELSSSNKDDQLVELHIGRKIVKRNLPKPSSSKDLLKDVSISNISSSDSYKHPRPDDPAPRGVPMENRSRRSITPSSSLATTITTNSEKPAIQNRRPSSNQFAFPPPPSFLRKHKIDSIVSTTSKASNVEENGEKMLSKKRGGNHTPGRRGEKRPKRMKEDELSVSNESNNQMERDMDPFIIVKQEEGEIDNYEDGQIFVQNDPVQNTTRIEKNSRMKKESSYDSLGNITRMSATSSNTITSSIEDKNRSLIKKLVHYQLLGKGVEKHEPAYSSCFGITCQGTMTALRKSVKTEPIDKQITASIIEKHLEMYL